MSAHIVNGVLFSALCVWNGGQQRRFVSKTANDANSPTQGQQLQYFEALMLVCERLGCPEGAAQFAQAAVHQVDAAYSSDSSNEAARHAREGRLWTNLFVYYLEAGRMEVRRYSQTPSKQLFMQPCHSSEESFNPRAYWTLKCYWLQIAVAQPGQEGKWHDKALLCSNVLYFAGSICGHAGNACA